jgi:excisionase family DNA binding protein
MHSDTEAPRAKTIEEFARDWRLGRTTVYQLASQGRLKLTKIGKLTRILAQHEAEFAASLTTSDAA